jgi:hypothetical protein
VIAAAYTAGEVQGGFVVVVGLMLLVTVWARGGLGLLCLAGGAGLAWALCRDQVAPEDVAGLVFLGAIGGMALAFLAPSRRGA